MAIPIYRLPENALINIIRNMDEFNLFIISMCSKRTASLVNSLSRHVTLTFDNQSFVHSVPIPFRLYQLPKNALISVLKNMDLCRLFFLSLTSKHSKSLIKSLDLKARSIGLLLSDHFVIQISFETGRRYLHFYFPPFEDNAPELVSLVTVMQKDLSIQFQYPQSSFGKLFHHLIDIFNQKAVDCVIQRPTKQIDFQSLKEALENVDIKRAYDYDEVYFYDFLEMFPQTKEYVLDPSEDVNIEFSQKFIFQNLDYFYLGTMVSFNLNALLSMNCSNIETDGSTLTDKEINRFIKNWVNGSNPRLEYLRMTIDNFENRREAIFHEEVIMKNISYKKVPMDQKRTFKLSTDIKEYPNRRAEINGRIDIIRKDGTKATIFIGSGGGNFLGNLGNLDNLGNLGNLGILGNLENLGNLGNLLEILEIFVWN